MKDVLEVTEENIKLFDPIENKTWEVPRRKTKRIVADVAERWVINVIVPEAVCRKIVKAPFLKPVPTPAGYVLSLCSIFMRHAAPEWAPLEMGPSSKNCALRIACVDTRNRAQAVWVDHRYSDSLLVETLAKLDFPRVYANLNVKTGRDTQGRRRFEMHTISKQLHLKLKETAFEKQWTSKAFDDAKTFENYFTAGVRSYGPGKMPDEATIVDLHKRSDNHFVAMNYYNGTLKTQFGAWQIDSVYRTENGLYEWCYEGDVKFE